MEQRVRLEREWHENAGAMGAVLQALPAFLVRQRWYPAKDAGIPTVQPELIVPLGEGGPASALAVWSVEPPGRPAMRLFVPLVLCARSDIDPAHPSVIATWSDGDALVVDALAVDGFVRQLVRTMLAPSPPGLPMIECGRSERFTPADFGADLEAPRDWAIRRSTAEQSNSSIRIGEGTILKVIRRLETGTHPELEMGRFLTDVAAFDAVPALLAWMSVDGAALGILQRFIANDGDGWGWVGAHLRAGGPASPASVLPWIETLGATTARLHSALATPTSDPDFLPEAASVADWQRWTAQTAELARRAREALKAALPADSTQPLYSLIRTFEQRYAVLTDTLHRFTPVLTVSKTRHHGDYHLGQTLVHGAEAIIVDFEGEPLRPLGERRAKHLPLRDVAGMLRSFAYAAAVAERELPADCPPPQRAAAHSALEQWARASSDAFLEAYLSAHSRGPGCPSERGEALRLIRFFVLEKALYEVLYELANRPAWVEIPLRAVVALLEHVALGETGGGDGKATLRRHRMPHGCELLEAGGAHFRLWAPGVERVRVELLDAAGAARAFEMSRAETGWHDTVVAAAHAGDRYHFLMPDGQRVPDPASRFQPEDVHGPSEIIDPAHYAWKDSAWSGRPWHEAVIYELHLGAFTPEGTFRAAMGRLDHLAELGITAIEIMPVGDFPGRRNWGYDGVLPYAPDSSYGRPEDFKALVDAAHQRGMMVLLDVVYNHFGPDGNFLPLYAPAFFTDRHKTPWGAGINFDGPHSQPVREFVIHNALYWLEEFHLDGLRLDAVHAILDDGARHVLDELAERVHSRQPAAHLVLENEHNETHRLLRDAGGMPLHYTAQWNDDLHHVLHVAATGEDAGYYADYRNDTELLGRALAEGFAFQGQMMPFRGSPRGEPSGGLPSTAFVSFIQNHDQIGNRAFGERLTAIAPAPAVRACVATYLLLPQIPMLFMGEEWAASQAFAFFCDFDGDLAAAVRDGRRAEFAKFPEFRDESMRARIPDPQADATFEAAKLDWDERLRPAGSGHLEHYRQVLATRKALIVPLLPVLCSGRFHMLGPGCVVVQWAYGAQADRPAGQLTLAANLSNEQRGRFPPLRGREVWREGASTDGVFEPWTVRWSLADEAA